MLAYAFTVLTNTNLLLSVTEMSLYKCILIISGTVALIALSYKWFKLENLRSLLFGYRGLYFVMMQFSIIKYR